jgi:putative redox protein
MNIGFPGGTRVRADYKGFVIETDQPLHAGGGNSAPAPFDYFLASIGTCAGFYVFSFLTQRNLATEGVQLTLGTTKDPETGRVSEITLKVMLPESFPQKYEQAIVHAVNLCSVKKHIVEPPAFDTVVEIRSLAQPAGVPVGSG